MKDIWILYLRLPWDKKLLWTSLTLSLIPVSLVLMASTSPSPVTNKTAVAVDTHIPRGFVLVPIEVLNYEALDSILGQFGIVDLFSPQKRLVAKNVRLLRAPHNGAHFAILIPEKQTGEVLREGAAFTVIVKPSRTQGGTEFEFPQDKPNFAAKKRTITYGGD